VSEVRIKCERSRCETILYVKKRRGLSDRRGKRLLPQGLGYNNIDLTSLPTLCVGTCETSRGK